MEDLYDVLGVGKSATEQDIHKAFRNKSKSLHPDMGGDKEAFQFLVKAHDVLTNKQSRRIYDKTGRVVENPAQELEAEVYGVVTQFFQVALEGAAKQNATPEHVDIVLHATRMLETNFRQFESNIQTLEKKLAYERKFKRRVKVRRSKINLFEGLLDQRIQTYEAQKKELESKRIVFKKALELIKTYECKVDLAPAAPRYATTSASTIQFS